MDSLEQRVQHLITQPWSSLEAARAIIPMVLEEAAKWHDARAANAKKRYEELDRYSDCADERTGWRSWKDANDRHRHDAAAIRAMGAP